MGKIDVTLYGGPHNGKLWTIQDTDTECICTPIACDPYLCEPLPADAYRYTRRTLTAAGTTVHLFVWAKISTQFALQRIFNVQQ